jgi:hypothetical protein
MSEMVERVARAMAIDDGWEPGDRSWRVYLGAARTAIETMLVPTDGMLAAAGTRRPRGDEVMGPDHPWALWEAMIDAALEETTDV